MKSKTESMKKQTNSARQRADVLWAKWEDSESDGSDSPQEKLANKQSKRTKTFDNSKYKLKTEQKVREN